MKSFVQLSLVAIALVSMVACKASVSSNGGGGAVVPVDTFDNKVSGPVLNGLWQSQCVTNKWGEGYVTFAIAIKDQNIVRGVNNYSDPACTTQTGQTMQNGVFRFLAQYGADIYEVEYKFETPNGFAIVPGDNIMRQGDKLWISDHYIGDGMVPDIELDLVGDVQ